MSDQQQSTTSGRIIRYAPSCYLIGSFLWRVLTPAHEYPMRAPQVMEIVYDILLTGGLIAMKAKIPKPLFWVALIAGLGLFAIRLTSNASWWTGHLVFTPLPR